MKNLFKNWSGEHNNVSQDQSDNPSQQEEEEVEKWYHKAISFLFFLLGWAIPLALLWYGLIREDLPYQMSAVGVAVFIFAFYGISVRAPDIIQGFFWGHFVGKMPLKIAIGIPGILHLEPQEIRWIDAPFRDDDVYLLSDEKSESGTPLHEYGEIEGLIQFRKKTDHVSLRRGLQMPTGEMKQQLIAVGKTLSHELLGGKTIGHVNAHFGEIEFQAKEKLEEEAGHYGYEVRDFQPDLKFPTLKIRADGRARGYAAKQIHEHLEGNMPAAVTTSVQTLADAAKEIVKSFKPTRPSPPSRSNDEQSVGQQVGEAVDEILNRRQ